MFFFPLSSPLLPGRPLQMKAVHLPTWRKTLSRRLIHCFRRVAWRARIYCTTTKNTDSTREMEYTKCMYSYDIYPTFVAFGCSFFPDSDTSLNFNAIEVQHYTDSNLLLLRFVSTFLLLCFSASSRSLVDWKKRKHVVFFLRVLLLIDSCFRGRISVLCCGCRCPHDPCLRFKSTKQRTLPTKRKKWRRCCQRKRVSVWLNRLIRNENLLDTTMAEGETPAPSLPAYSISACKIYQIRSNKNELDPKHFL